MQIESKVRDWLSLNLSFIEAGLTLIEKEFYLPDNIGANGFIDLLCTDIYNNYVIIEIKRSNTSARQTINEILKYHSLIKHNFKARESEIKIIVISTHWAELIRPYSEMYHKVGITLKGYKIELDKETFIPNEITPVEPLDAIMIFRKFAYWQGFYLFKTHEKREVFSDILKQRVSEAFIDDFVVLNINGPPKNNRIITPYATIVAFQRLSPSELLNAINTLSSGENDVMDNEDFDDELAYQIHLEDAFIAALKISQYDDDTEAGYPEKLDGVLTDQGWTIQQINRYGIFEKDPRYSDDLLIKELKGHDGSSKNKFVGFAESTQKERLNELHRECMNSLAHTPQWAELVELALKELEQQKNRYRILIDIYNPDSIVTSFYFTLIKANPLYLPKYMIFIDYLDIDKSVIFLGDIHWNQKEPISKLFTTNNTNEIVDEVFRLQIDPDNFTDSIKMALIYTNKKIIIESNKKIYNEFIDINDKLFVVKDVNYKSIEEYIFVNKTIIEKFIFNYSSVAAPL
ncbi:MAG TPA: endonuclease NucS domain-containing protein [Mucilaginibacter sp.]|jgi:hypothetical protein|nr:endonuclease NucS domain-containing protein [Mucilaginibacter sp.]